MPMAITPEVLIFENKVNWENLVAYRVRNNG